MNLLDKAKDASIINLEKANAKHRRQIARLTRERDELREAVTPVILCGCSQVTDEVSDLSPVDIELNAGQFRRLALALQASANTEKETG